MGIGGKRESGAVRTPDDLHLLSAVPWDLQLPQTRDLELGPALAAHEVHVQVIDVLGLVAVATHPAAHVVICASAGTAALEAVLAAIEAAIAAARTGRPVGRPKYCAPARQQTIR